MALVPASSHGYSSSGGVLTGGVRVVPTSPTAQPFDFNTQDGNTELYMDSSGDVWFNNYGTNDSPQVTLTDSDGFTVVLNPRLGNSLQAHAGPGLDLDSRQVGGELLKARNSGSTYFLVMNDGSIGFFGHAPVARPTGVAVTAAAIHAALVSLGLITA